MVKLSVVIPTYNRRHVLERTLPALEAQDLAPEEFEVLIVEDGCTDGTDELLRNWKPKFVFHALKAPHRGAGAARNVGIQAAKGALVLFLDDDLIAIPDLLRQHCEAHSGPELEIIHGPISVMPGSAKTIIRHITELFYSEYNRSLTADLELRYPEIPGPRISMLSSMVNSSIPREALVRCGGFDERIWAAEDLELGLRLWKMGLPFRCRPTAMAYECYVKSSQNYLTRQAVALGTGDMIVCHKHPEYRPYSSMSSFGDTRPWKRWLRNLVMRFPLSPVPLLALPLRLEKYFFDITPLRKAGERVFRVAERIQRLRSGLKGAGSWQTLEAEFDRRLPVLMYHHVGPTRPGTYGEWSMTPKQFERQIRWLAWRGYVGVRPANWIRWRNDGTGMPRKPVLISFDDAYADTAEFAFPILEKYGFGAVMFVVTQRIGSTNTWDEAQGCGTLHTMTAERIRTWAARGIEFGGHSRTHADLSTATPAEIADEVAGCKRDLEDVLGAPVTTFAYPYGKYGEQAHDAVRRNYELGFGTQDGLNYLRTDAHLLRRMYAGPNQSLAAFAFNLYRGRSAGWVDRLRVRLGLRTRMKRLMRARV